MLLQPGNTALHEASWKGLSRCVQALCAVRGADLSLRNHAGFAPLHLACQNGHNQSCRELLLAGCDPDVRNNVSAPAPCSRLEFKPGLPVPVIQLHSEFDTS